MFVLTPTQGDEKLFFMMEGEAAERHGTMICMMQIAAS